MPALFFISYQHNSKRTAALLTKKLEDAGFTTWGYQEGLKPSDEWREVIDNSIKLSAGVIVVITRASLRSQYVTYEWSFAFGKGIPVIPLLLEEPEPDDEFKMHPRLEVIQWADYRDKKGFDWPRFIRHLQEIAAETDIPKEVRNAENDLSASDENVRSDGIRTLFASRHPSATAALVRAMTSSLIDVSSEAAIALSGKSGYSDLRVLSALSDAIRFDDERRSRALETLEKMNRPEAVACIMDTFEHLPEAVYQDLEGTLSGMNDPSVKPALRERLKRGPRNISVVIALGNLKDAEAVPALTNLLNRVSERGTDMAIPNQWEEQIIESFRKIATPIAANVLHQIMQNIGKQPQYQLVRPRIFELAFQALVNMEGDAGLIELRVMQSDPALKSVHPGITKALNKLEYNRR